MNELMILV